jgi:hypothetical protein
LESPGSQSLMNKPGKEDLKIFGIIDPALKVGFEFR